MLAIDILNKSAMFLDHFLLWNPGKYVVHCLTLRKLIFVVNASIRKLLNIKISVSAC